MEWMTVQAVPPLRVSLCMNYNWNSYEISPGHIVIVVTGA